MTDPIRAPADLAAALDREVEGLERELAEIELLAGQARSESGRHEQKRAHLAEKLADAHGRALPRIGPRSRTRTPSSSR